MIIVAGITRSGLTMIMQMLHAGGYQCAGEYPAFEKYPIGEVVWGACRDQAVKLVDAQLQIPTKLKNQKVIIPLRDLHQQAKSFNKFIGMITGAPPMSESALVRSFRKDYSTIFKWAKKQNLLKISFEDTIKKPEVTAELIASFSGKKLNVNAMAKAVMARTPLCHSELLETRM